MPSLVTDAREDAISFPSTCDLNGAQFTCTWASIAAAAGVFGGVDDSVALGDEDDRSSGSRATDVADSDISRRIADAAVDSVAVSDNAGALTPRTTPARLDRCESVAVSDIYVAGARGITGSRGLPLLNAAHTDIGPRPAATHHGTTVYLTERQKRALERSAKAVGRSEAELIREGVDIVTGRLQAAEARLPLFESGDPDLASRIDEELVGFGE
jgi:hypothetical protein